MPTNTALMLTAQYVKDNTVINNNVDNELIEPFIIQAQNVRIESILGTGLFNELCTQIINNSVGSDNKVLLDSYVLPALKEWVVYESLPFLNYKMTNKAVSKKNSDNSEPADLSEIRYIRESVRNIAEYMSNRIVEYLKTQTQNGKYPLYLNPGSTCDTIRPNSDNYFNGLYLG